MINHYSLLRFRIRPKVYHSAGLRLHPEVAGGRGDDFATLIGPFPMVLCGLMCTLKSHFCTIPLLKLFIVKYSKFNAFVLK